MYTIIRSHSAALPLNSKRRDFNTLSASNSVQLALVFEIVLEIKPSHSRGIQIIFKKYNNKNNTEVTYFTI
jgi:hypothetical protein